MTGLYVQERSTTTERNNTIVSQKTDLAERDDQLAQVNATVAAQDDTIQDLESKALDPTGYALVQACVAFGALSEQATQDLMDQLSSGGIDSGDIFWFEPDGMDIQLDGQVPVNTVCREAAEYLE